MVTPQPAAFVGGPRRTVEDAQLRAFVAEQLGSVELDGRSVCLVVPDATRSAPMPQLLSAVYDALAGRVTRLTALIALGTHAEMPDAAVDGWLAGPGSTVHDRFPQLTVLNHLWRDPATFARLGTITDARVAELTGGRLDVPIHVELNRAVVEHDVVLVIGPVFPHEVVGFSGGNKYFVPGVAGQEIIDITHWVGALITSAGIIGTRGTTPVRALIDEAAALIPARRLALCVVARSGSGELEAAAFGTPEAAWAAAAEVAAQTHVRYLDAPVRRVVSVMGLRYQDMWTAAKGFYKVEPVVADGGEVIILAPHVHDLALTHPEIADIGYHCRDYFLGQWERFAHVHWGVLAHSTHLRGAGTWTPADGERDRVTVTLATGIPEDVVRGANLNYRDPADVDLVALDADPDTLVVRDAGEVLFRLR